MNTMRNTLVLGLTLVMSLALAIGPAAATEGTHEKVSLPQTQHDLIGLFLIGVVGLFALAGFANARRQLKGERDQASGEFRWR